MIQRVLEQQEGVAQSIRQMVHKCNETVAEKMHDSGWIPAGCSRDNVVQYYSSALSNISQVLFQLEAQKVDLKAVITDAERTHKMVSLCRCN